MKICPYCAEEIQDEAIYCRYCRRDLVSKDQDITPPHGVPLPAMPGDSTTQCTVNCKCRWEIQPINADNGDFDVYWKMADADADAVVEHCQTCQVRAADWNPLRIREWTYRLPSQQVLTEQLAEEVADRQNQ